MAQKSVDSKVGQSTDVVIVPNASIYVASCEIDKATRSIRSAISSVASNFISIGHELSFLKVESLNLLGFVDVYDYALKTFGFKSTSTKNYINVAKRFGSPDSKYLASKYRDYSFSQLVELLPVKEIDNSYSPSLSVKEIRDVKIVSSIKSDLDAVRKYLNESCLKAFSFLTDLTIKINRVNEVGDQVSLECIVTGLFTILDKPSKFSAEIDYSYTGFTIHSFGLKVSNFWSSCYESGLKTLFPKLNDCVTKFKKDVADFVKDSKDSKGSSKPAVEPSWTDWYKLSVAEKIKSFSKEHIRSTLQKCFNFYLYSITVHLNEILKGSVYMLHVAAADTSVLDYRFFGLDPALKELTVDEVVKCFDAWCAAQLAKKGGKKS